MKAGDVDTWLLNYFTIDFFSVALVYAVKIAMSSNWKVPIT